MDIHCPTCGQPWGALRMREGEPTQWGIPKADQKRLRDAGAFSGADDPALAAAKAAGWQFASDRLLSFTHCPSCPQRGALPDANRRRAFVAIAGPLLDSDMEAFMAFLADELVRATEEAPAALLFPLGRVYITPGALDATRDADMQPTALLRRHARGDWPELDEADLAYNRKAVDQGLTVVSVYTLKTGQRVYVVTECDRSATTLLLPSEY